MRTLRKNADAAAQAAEKIKALGHPLRLRIVAILSENDANVTALSEELGVQQSVVSQHLRILRMGGLVDVLRENGFATYRLLEQRITKLLDCVESAPWR
jgi:DNA-binding transcriptional ArsR family regulator